MKPEHIKKIGTYFQRNYIEGERISTIPNDDWKSWKEDRFQEIGYYDYKNNRQGDYANKDKAPPRIHLRGDGDFSDLKKGHLEFKCWLQTKVEEVALGESSPKFLAQEKATSERDRAMDTWGYLSDYFEEIIIDLFFSDQHLENNNFLEPKHLLLLWKILATVNPDFNSFKKGIIENPSLKPSMLEKDSFNPILKISRELARVIIAESKSTVASPKQIYQQIEGVDGGNKLRKFATKQTEVNITDADKLWEITSKLVKAKIEPPEDWKWINISISGMTLMAVLSNKIENILLDARKIAIRHVKHKSYKLQDEFGIRGFTFDEKTAYNELKDRGFGTTNLPKSETPEHVTKHNAIKLTYNLLNMLLDPKDAILRRDYMTNEEYIEHFLDGDDSLFNNTKQKHQPHNLYFTTKMKKLIKSSDYKNFREGTEHPIYRWLRGSQHRWMYCPPVLHTSNTTDDERGGTTDYEAGGFLFKQNRKIIGGSHDRYEIFETPRCEISDDLIDALNTLQDTQWEINLHFLKAFFEIKLDDGTMLETTDWRDKELRIISLKPKSEFKEVFTPNDQNGKESRVNVLEWARRIIEHNANVFWHSWICDFRGRMSPRCTKLSPQGDDLDRALIRFKEWKSLGDEGIFWFRVHLHNMMEGIEWKKWKGKKPAEKHCTFFERSKWVEENIDQLRILAKNPIKYREILELDKYRSGKSEAFQRLAILIEIDRIYDEYDNNGKNWEEVKSGQVVYLDASCNGYQHLAANFRDEELAEKVNISMNGDRPQDLYDIVSNNVDDTKARAFLNKHLPNSIDIESILNKTFSRSTAKMPTMTRAYGSKDIAKCLSGKNGRGKSKFHEVDFPVSEFSAKDEVEYKEIPDNVKSAYKNYDEGRIFKSEFTDLIRNGKGKKNKAKAKRWEKLLSNKRYISLWNEGSALHKALLENPDEVSKFFNENPELQPQYTEIIKSAFSDSISKTASNYDELENQLEKISDNSDGLWPGITWNLPDKFIVNHYYIKTYQRDKSSKGMPCKTSSAYSSFVPEWYKSGKSKKTISNRIIELYLPKNEKKWNKNILKNKDLKEDIQKNYTKGLSYKLMLKVMLCIDPKNSLDDANEIKRLLTHANYTLQLYDSVEKNRINPRKLKSALAPNFIHSLDAYHMRFTINQMASGSPNFSFWAVHDAFGVHAQDIPELREIVRKGLHELHKERDFNHWLDEMSDSGTITSNKIGDDAWLSKILKAEYLIS